MYQAWISMSNKGPTFVCWSHQLLDSDGNCLINHKLTIETNFSPNKWNCLVVAMCHSETFFLHYVIDIWILNRIWWNHISKLEYFAYLMSIYCNDIKQFITFIFIVCYMMINISNEFLSTSYFIKVTSSNGKLVVVLIGTLQKLSIGF